MASKASKKESLSEAIRDIFRDGEVEHFHFSDSLTMIEGDTYLRCRKKSTDTAEISFGGDNDEVTIKVCHTAEQLRLLVRALLM